MSPAGAGGGLLPGPTPEERKDALERPDISWTDWFYRSFLKVWIPLGFLVVDSWIAGYWLEARLYVGLLPSLAVAVYLEYLGYQALWHEPEEGITVSSGDRRRWLHPVLYGRWTEPGTRIRHGLSPYRGEAVEPGTPDPAEFF